MFVVALVLLVATTVHEFGHLVAARARRARVVRICVGRGPKVIALRRSGTLYELRILPLGGRVEFQRPVSGTANAVIAVGGAVANVVFGFLVLWTAAGLIGVERMPFGDASLGPLDYATGATTAWLRVVPATVFEFLTYGQSRTFTLALDAIIGLLLTPNAASALHAIAAVSIVWAVLNMIPIPGLGTDGWRFITAFGDPLGAAGAHGEGATPPSQPPGAAEGEGSD